MALWTLAVTEGKPQGSGELLKPDVGRIQPLGFTQNGAFYYAVNTGIVDIYIAEIDLASGTALSMPSPLAHRYLGSNRHPDWSSDGKLLAYISARGPVPDSRGSGSTLIIRSLATGQERELRPELAEFRWPRWSPKGGSILVEGRDAKGREGFYLVDAQTGKTTLLVPIAHHFLMPAWAPDGKSIFYQESIGSTDQRPKLVRRNLEAGQDRDLLPADFQVGKLGNLVVSPDGRWLAFSLSDATRDTSLLVIPTVGGEPREVLRVRWPEFITENAALAWTPDGQQLLFTTIQRNEPELYSHKVWRVSWQGGEARPVGLALEGVVGHLRVHPDGRRVAFTAGQAKNEIWVLENFLPELKAAKQ